MSTIQTKLGFRKTTRECITRMQSKGVFKFIDTRSYMITVELHEISKANRVSEDIERAV